MYRKTSRETTVNTRIRDLKSNSGGVLKNGNNLNTLALNSSSHSEKVHTKLPSGLTASTNHFQHVTIRRGASFDLQFFELPKPEA